MGKIDAHLLRQASSRLGDVVVDPALWTEVMDEICRAINAKGAALLQGDVRTPDVPITESVREFFEFYFREGWHERDLRATTVPLLLNGRPVVRDQDVGPPDVMRTHPFYNECIYEGGLHWFAAVGIRVGPTLWGMTLQRTTKQGAFSRQEMELLAPLSPRLSEVATLSDAVGRSTLSSCINALDAVRQPAIAVDRLGFVLDANAAAQSVFDSDICIRNRQVFVTDHQARLSLDSLRLRLMSASETTVFSKIEPIAIRRSRRRPIVLRVLPVPASARSPFLGARAILTLTPMEPRPDPDMAMLSKAFPLTPAELRLVAALADGKAIDKAAEVLGISRETARTQIKSVFVKTGTNRQSELVALLARL